MPGFRLAPDGWLSHGSEPRIPAGLGASKQNGMREEKVLDDANNKVGNPSHGPLALSWDTLPELAKNRWEEAVAFDVTVENQLAKAKADRSLAESERQRIAKESLDATKDVC